MCYALLGKALGYTDLALGFTDLALGPQSPEARRFLFHTKNLSQERAVLPFYQHCPGGLSRAGICLMSPSSPTAGENHWLLENFKFMSTHAQHSVPTSANVALYEIMG